MFKTPTFGEKRPASVLAAVAGAQTPWIKELWPDPAALFRVDDARRQLWFAVGAQLALRPERAEVPAAPAELAAWLESARAGEILRRTGLGAPPGWRRALGRLGPFAFKQAANYLALFDLLAEGGPGGSILRHATEVTERLIAALAALEPNLRQPKLIEALITTNDARLWMWRLNRVRVSAPEAAAAIEAAVRDGAMPVYLLLETEGPAINAPLPPPPWPGTERLRPLATAAAMIDAGKRYNNCLLHQIDNVREERHFYYELDGEPGMIVELERDAPYGWKVDSARLRRNRQPSAEAMRRLAAELEGTEVFFSPAHHEEEEDDVEMMIPGRHRRHGR